MNAEEMGVVFARDYFPWILGALIGFIASLITDRCRRKKKEEQNSLASRIDDRPLKEQNSKLSQIPQSTNTCKNRKAKVKSNGKL